MLEMQTTLNAANLIELDTLFISVINQLDAPIGVMIPEAV